RLAALQEAAPAPIADQAGVLPTEQEWLFDLAHDSIFIRDLAGRILYWNLGCEQLYGYTRQEAVGQNAQQLLQTAHPQSHQATQRHIVEHGYWEGELVHTAK